MKKKVALEEDHTLHQWPDNPNSSSEVCPLLLKGHLNARVAGMGAQGSRHHLQQNVLYRDAGCPLKEIFLQATSTHSFQRGQVKVSRSRIKDVAKQLEKICRQYGVDLIATDDKTGIFIQRFQAQTPGWNKGTIAMTHIIRHCRLRKMSHIRLNAYPINNTEWMQITNMKLMRWYERFGFKPVMEYEPNGCNELVLDLAA